jgi:hypothetical protein
VDTDEKFREEEREMRVRNGLWLAAAAGAVMTASSANAAFQAFIQIIAERDGVTSDHTFDMGVQEGSEFHWSWGALTGDNSSPLIFGNGAQIHGASLDLHADPLVSANFNVAASFSNTTFTINSAIVNHPSEPSNVGRASAFIGVTDSALAGDIGSVSLTGLQPGAKAYQAVFNGSTVFTNLLSSFSGGAGSSAQTETTAGFLDPAYLPLGGVATSIQSQFKFSLSRFDRASGTSTFEVIPAPGAASLLALGGLVAARRRRSC